MRQHVVSVPQRAPEHGRGCRFKRGCRVERLVALSEARGAARQRGGDIKSDRCRPGGEPERMGWCYAHAEGSGATSEGSGRVAGTRGSRKDAALVS